MKTDLRIRKTRGRLVTALVALLQEKPLEKISLQELLDRADVGRSTFYLHYRDKEDLVLCMFEDGLEMWSTILSRNREKSLRVAAVAEYFAHVRSAKKFYRALMDSGRLQSYFDLAEGYFARGIERRLTESKKLTRLSALELRARSHGLAGSLNALLKWWMDHGAKQSPETMDGLFHRMVWKGAG